MYVILLRTLYGVWVDARNASREAVVNRLPECDTIRIVVWLLPFALFDISFIMVITFIYTIHEIVFNIFSNVVYFY